ncbi:MAG: hypothetical protein KDA97_08465 [Acidimicrobiales bacterium]|nr:hypothetical protein [Acidimicrobiales bacterium]
MGQTNGIAVTFSRPTDFTREAEWDEWYDDQHLPDTVGESSGAWVVTRFETVERPPLFSAPVGFTHMTVHEFTDVDEQGPRFVERLRSLRSEGRIHPLHAVIGLDVFRAVGEWSAKPAPSDALVGHVFAYTMANDLAREEEWNQWYDAVHVPDMMEADAFSATTRWERLDRTEFGPNFWTLYDVELPDVSEAVARSGAVMPGIIERGRLSDLHAGGLRCALEATGRYGGAGLLGTGVSG